MLKKLINFVRAEIRFKNILTISNLCMVILIYCTAITCIILTSFDFSENFWSKLINKQFTERRIAFYSVDDRIGEAMLYDKVKKSLSKKGIDYAAAKFPENYINFYITKHFYQISTNLINYFFQPQFNLALTHYVTLLPLGYNIVYLNVPNEMLFNKKGKFKERFEHLINYDTYIDLYSMVNGSNKFLEEALKCHKCYDTKPRKIFAGYLAHEYVDYKPAKFGKAVITGSLWGCNRDSFRMASALKKLEQDDLLIAYGLSRSLNFLTKSYKGPVEKFNKEGAAANLYKLHNENGIALIIHNMEHMLEGIPTIRILEAIASGAIAITDQNRFITKFFGDTVLYFDAFGTEDEIYTQVKHHIEWIKNHPKEAEAKAKSAYNIFINNFTMEKQLEQIMQQKL